MLKSYNRIHAKPDWFPTESWKDEIVIVIAAGPSAKLDYEPYRGKAKFIVINNSRELVPWADVLVSSDGDWWNRNKGAQDFLGLKLTMDFPITRQYPNVHLLRISKSQPGITIDRPGYVGVGLNSGFYAINIAVQFGPPKKIILCGFDMNMISGVHWHGKHPHGSGNPNNDKLYRWRKVLDKQSSVLKGLGVCVINTCLTSSLKNYPKMSLAEAFNWKEV